MYSKYYVKIKLMYDILYSQHHELPSVMSRPARTPAGAVVIGGKFYRVNKAPATTGGQAS